MGIVSTGCELAGLVAFAVAAFLAFGVIGVLPVVGVELLLIGFVLEPPPKRKRPARG